MQAPTLFSIAQQQFWLTANKCLYWENEQALIVSDLHLGKTGHFRKHGLPIPADVYVRDLHTLLAAIQFFKPTQLIIVGDMFHSKANKELALFTKWRNDIAATEIHLVKGNHDILPDTFYANHQITIHPKLLVKQNICFQHDINEEINTNYYYITGHVHPGIQVRNKSRQTLTMPCFYFSAKYAILPAFSAFTGLYVVSPTKSDTVFAIANNTLLQL